jgi:hypothetical protein
MSQKYKKLRQQILILYDLHQTWSSINIANELINSDCPPPQTRNNLLRYIDYTIERGTIETRRRSGRYSVVCYYIRGENSYSRHYF